jgi:hypothetical protein
VITVDALRYAGTLLGYRFLAYASGSTFEEVSARFDGDLGRLAGHSEDALMATLDQALQWVQFPAVVEQGLTSDENRPDGSPGARMRRFAWVDTAKGQSWANLLRLSSGATLPAIPPGLDPAAEALAEAALDFYPVTLVPLPSPGQPFLEFPITSHARADAFVAAIQADHSLDPLIQPGRTWYTSSGFGFETQEPLYYLARILASAEQQVRAFQGHEPIDFVSAAVDALAAARLLCEHGSAAVPAMIGFAHADLPDEVSQLRGPRGGRLRVARETDIQLLEAAPATIVLETTSDLVLSFDDSTPASRAKGREQLAIDAHLISLAALLATQSEDVRALPLMTWTKVFDPLSPFVGSLTPERRGIAAATLSDYSLVALQDWIERLETHYDRRFQVAITRCISAFAERDTAEDALIDLVIALESMFGGPGGELRFRISAALGWLLGDSPAERRQLQQEAKRIYDVRSAIVHGGELPDGDAYSSQLIAERLLLDSLARLFNDRPELISDPERATTLILDA